MSPRRAITTASPLRLTSASANWPGILVSFHVDDELDRVVHVVRCDVHLVHHVLDQEEAPAARLLETGELRFDIGGLDLGDLFVAAAVVRDRDLHRTVED